MRLPVRQLIVVMVTALLAAAPASAEAPDCARQVLALQVWLDRQGFSPGVIDGKPGANTRRALDAYRAARGLTGQLATNECASIAEVSQAGGSSGTTTYQVTAEDAAEPFEPLPNEIADQAGRPALGYESLIEKLAERFHATPALIQALNPGVNIAPGVSIIVPDVDPFDPLAKPARGNDGPVSVEVTREGELRVYGADGTVVFYAPASSGSEHDPLPAGQWKVTGVSWLPTFHYNPDLFWDAESTDTKATLAPGPNNPVGVVWIDIDVKHYGVHGTPEPSRIGYTESHGCVRLTNWDAATLASLVTVGTPIRFK